MANKVTLSNKTKRTKQELREASKHIFWGMRYLSEKLELFLRFSKMANEKEFNGLLNSIHCSFLIDARKMIEFLYNSVDKLYDNDLIAEDFFENPEIWRELRPKQPDILKQTKQDVGKLLAHFTYQVKKYPLGRKTWKTSDIYVDVFIAFQIFLDTVNNSLLDEQCNYLRRDNPDIIICYPVFPPEGKAPYQIACTRDVVSGLEIIVGD